MSSSPETGREGLVPLDDGEIESIKRRALEEARRREEIERLKREHPSAR